MTLTREDLADPQKYRRIEQVELPELGKTAYVRSLTALERDAHDASVNDGQKRDLANLSARLVARCLCDEQGALLFEDFGAGAAALGKMPATVVEPLYRACMRINGYDRLALELAEKNFGPGPDSSSSTA